MAEHVARKLERWISKHADTSGSQPSLKYQRLIAKYERELLRCGEETHALSRFSNAQVVAFRKILKKYRVSCDCRIYFGGLC